MSAPTGALADRLNRQFDRMVGDDVIVAGRTIHSWRAFSLAAFGVATFVWLVIGVARGLSLVVLIAVPPVPFAIFSAQRRSIIRSGRGARLVFHRHLVASALVLVPLAAALGALSWRGVDAAATAVLAGLAIGRVGCLRSGCCTGRPCAIGLRYTWLGSDHRRLPVQALDATACVLLAGGTIACHALHVPAGIATAAGLGGYFAVRFFLDELRYERVVTGRYTEAQRLIAVAAAAAAVWALAAAVSAAGVP